MPSHGRAVELKLPELEALAELYGVRFDLEDAADFCRRAIASFEEHGYHQLQVHEAFAIAAVVVYARCFHSGARRRRHPREFPSLTPELRQVHDFYFALRNRYVAHAENVFDETWVTTTATMKDGVKLPVRDLNPGRERSIIGAHEASELLPVIQAAIADIDVEIESAKRTALEFVQSLPLDVVHAADLRCGFEPSTSDVHKSRRRLRRKAPVAT